MLIGAKRFVEHTICSQPNCGRISRIGDFCFIHNPNDPNICKRIVRNKICGKPLKRKGDGFDEECSYHMRHSH